MSVLTLGLYAEGTTDYVFLQPIIQRTTEHTLAEHGRSEKETVQKATMHRPRRLRESDISFLYQPMGEKANLLRLRQVGSYKQFVTDLIHVLQKIGKIPKIYRY